MATRNFRLEEARMTRKEPNRSEKPSRDRASDELLWLETYFIVFPTKRRPTLSQVERALAEAGPRLKLGNLSADEDGLFASVLIESPEDHAAVEVSYEASESVIEQNLEWAKQMQGQLTPKQLQQLVAADARLDVAHFERVRAGAAPEGGGRKAGDFPGDEFGDDDADDEAAMESFDPTCLLTVVEALSTLTKGLTFDPASGEVV
jgi:hypothetical protein